MAINFPPKPQPDGKEYVDPNSGKWTYDKDNNSWTLTAPGNVSPFNYRGGHDFASATVPESIKPGDGWTHSGTDGAAINAAYTGMSGTIASGQFVVYDGSVYTKVSSVVGYPNTGDGDGATLDTRYVKTKGETKQGIEGSLGIGTDSPAVACEISGTTANASRLRVTRSGSSGELAIIENDAVVGGLGSNGTNGGIRLYAGGSEKARLVSSGDFMIGPSATPESILSLKKDNKGGEGPVLTFRNSSGDSGTSCRINFIPNQASGAVRAASIISTNDGTTRADLGFYTSDGTPPTLALKIDSQRRVLINNDASINGLGGLYLQTAGSQAQSGFSQACYNAGPGGAIHTLYHSKTNTIDSHTILSENDRFGEIRFIGSDGFNARQGAMILGQADKNASKPAGQLVAGTEYKIVGPGDTDWTAIGAADNNKGTVFTATGAGTGTGRAIVSSGNMPGRLTFWTTSDGSVTPTERMRITSDGFVGINATAPVSPFQVVSSLVATSTANSEWTGVFQSDGKRIQIGAYGSYPAIQAAGTSTSGNLLLNPDTGNVGIGLDGKSAPGEKLHVEGRVRVGGDAKTGTADGVILYSEGQVSVTRETGKSIWGGFLKGNSNFTSRITSDGDATFTGTTTATVVAPSDVRFGANITPAGPQLADVVALGGLLKNYDWTADAPFSAKIRSQRQLGLIAQEVDDVCPSLTKTIHRTKQGKELTPEQVVPPVYEEQVVPAVYEEKVVPAVYETRSIPAEFDEDGNEIAPASTEEVLVSEEYTEQVLVSEAYTEQVVMTPEQVIPATYEEVDDSYKGISQEALVMKLIGAVAELSGKVEALEAAIATKGA